MIILQSVLSSPTCNQRRFSTPKVTVTRTQFPPEQKETVLRREPTRQDDSPTQCAFAVMAEQGPSVSAKKTEKKRSDPSKVLNKLN